MVVRGKDKVFGLALYCLEKACLNDEIVIMRYK
ncbi:hypothetical protein PEDI_07920 [Persicobacter diffluens]|uniref:Uncharacterized protein n=1 Tax=Persicobacter diffluens TaxID=981 RepID=A0AAN4VWU7_9BACT|nr:hypothetical protein PEDI_07920 [Persicobacter diffluens]